MNWPDESRTHADYLSQVGHLLADVDADERASILANLQEQLDEVPAGELGTRLGSPQEFVREYRRSAGIENKSAESRYRASLVASVISTLLLPFGALMLLSFGGQLLLGPFVLAIEWILARVSPKPLRIAWSVLAGALAGEIAVILLNVHVLSINTSMLSIGTYLIFLVAILIAVPVAVLFYRTSSGEPRS